MIDSLSRRELAEQDVFVDDHLWRVGSVAAGASNETFQHLGVLDRSVRHVQVSVGLGQQAAGGYRVGTHVEPRYDAVRHLHLQRAARNARNRSRSALEYVLCNDSVVSPTVTGKR